MEVSVAFYARDHLQMTSRLNSFERDGHHRFPIDSVTNLGKSLVATHLAIDSTVILCVR